jgi:hypothetical protein
MIIASQNINYMSKNKPNIMPSLEVEPKSLEALLATPEKVIEIFKEIIAKSLEMKESREKAMNDKDK